MSAAAGPAPAPGQALPSRAHALRRLRGYLLRNKGLYGFWIVLMLLYDACFVAVPLLVGWAVAGVEQGLAAERVWQRCAVLGAVTGVGALLRFFSRTLVFNAAREIEYEIRGDLFAHLQRLPQSFFARWRTGDLMSRCVNDLNAVRLLLGVGLLNVVQTPFLYALSLTAMFTLDARLALLVLIPYPLFIAIARVFGRSMYAANIGVQEGLADLSNQLQEDISGIAVVKSYAMEEETRRRFESSVDDLYGRQLRLVRVNGALPAITSLLPALAMWIVLLVGGRSIESGQMSQATFFTFAMFIYQLTFPTFIMGWVFALVQRGAASMQRIDEVLSVDPSIADRSDAVGSHEVRGEIEIRDLTFHYPGRDGDPALREVSLRVPAGSVLGIVGPVGAGKTTLASLIPRLYEVPDAHVFIDGVDVNRVPLATLRSNIAMVPQDAFLFSMSLAENVAYGLAEADPAKVGRAADRAQLAKDVADLPQGYQTVVGERGVMLSGGQRQRTALARALALDPRILILDDTLSAVDAETETAIQRKLARLFSGRTVVVIAHRLSSVRHADQILVLDDGRIAERGSHDELVARGGLYARMARDQALEEKVDAFDDAESAA